MLAHSLVAGDCLDGMKALGPGSVDHIITDPPYEKEAHTGGRRQTGRVGDHGAREIVVKPIRFPPITELERNAFAVQAARVVRRWVLVFCQAEAVGTWRDALVAAGLVYKRACIWVKPDGQPQYSGDRPGMGYESMVLAHQPGRSRWNGGGRVGVYTFNKGEPDPAVHQTQKPVALIEALVRDFTDPGELICDPFAGSGTTGVACKHLGRGFLGWEIDPDMAAVGQDRITRARQQLEIPAVRPRKVMQEAFNEDP